MSRDNFESNPADPNRENLAHSSLLDEAVISYQQQHGAGSDRNPPICTAWNVDPQTGYHNSGSDHGMGGQVGASGSGDLNPGAYSCAAAIGPGSDPGINSCAYRVDQHLNPDLNPGAYECAAIIGSNNEPDPCHQHRCSESAPPGPDPGSVAYMCGARIDPIGNTGGIPGGMYDCAQRIDPSGNPGGTYACAERIPGSPDGPQISMCAEMLPPNNIDPNMYNCATRVADHNPDLYPGAYSCAAMIGPDVAQDPAMHPVVVDPRNNIQWAEGGSNSQPSVDPATMRIADQNSRKLE